MRVRIEPVPASITCAGGGSARARLVHEDGSHPQRLTVHGAPKNITATPRLAYQMIYVDSEALYNGARLNKRWDWLGLELHKPLNHPQFPLIPLG